MPIFSYPEKAEFERKAALKRRSRGPVIVRMEAQIVQETMGATIALAIGALIMLGALFVETSAIRLAAYAAIWTGWNVLWGIGVLSQRKVNYTVYREIKPHDDQAKTQA